MPILLQLIALAAARETIARLIGYLFAPEKTPRQQVIYRGILALDQRRIAIGAAIVALA